MPSHLSAWDHLPARLYTAESVRQLDQMAIRHENITAFDLMVRAGEAAFACMLSNWPEMEEVVVFAGRGNNGGDGYVVAALAATHGLKVSLYQIGDHRQQSDEAHQAQQMALDAGVVPHRVETVLSNGELFLPYPKPKPANTVIVDAILGTGLDSLVRRQYAELIHGVNTHPSEVIAMDIPSGLSSDTGRPLGCAIQAALTVNFVAVKQGVLSHQGPDYCGKICYAQLSISDEVFEQKPEDTRRISWHALSRLNENLGERFGNAHKGHFGHTLIIGGARGMAGAAIMASEAALRTGSGLVSCATAPGHQLALLARRPETMVHEVESGQALLALMERPDVIAIGPGLGQKGWSEQLLQQVFDHLDQEYPPALVLDADALNLLARPNWQRSFNDIEAVMTPHPGEASRLLGCRVEDIENNRFEAARKLAAKYQATVVLKGRGSLIASPDGRLSLCSDGNPGMATGGMGDVLTGVISALMAQGMDAYSAACWGVCLHSAAADRVADKQGQRGLLATDLMPEIQLLNNT